MPEELRPNGFPRLSHLLPNVDPQLLRDKNLRDQVRDLLKVLDDRERKIIFQRFGLDGGNPKTLEVVGKRFGVTRERIRQLQNVALDKLRRALRKKETQQAAPVVATGAPFRLPQAKAAHRAAKATLHLIVEPEISHQGNSEASASVNASASYLDFGSTFPRKADRSRSAAAARRLT